MGCVAAKPNALPREDDFLVPHGKFGKPLSSNLVSEQSVRLCLPSGALRAFNPCTVKTADGTDFVKLMPKQATMEVLANDTDDNPISVLKLQERRSFVAFNEDTDSSELHFYIYSYLPRIDCQGKEDETVDGKPLYMWARVSVGSPGRCMCSGAGNEQIFTMHMASRVKVRNNCEMFQRDQDPEVYKSKSHAENALSVKKCKLGACLISEAEGAFSFECGGCHCATVAPGVDPVLMIFFAAVVDFCRVAA